MSLQAWADLDEDEQGELVDGQLVEEEVPNTLHEVVVSWFIAMLRAWAAPRGGWVLGSEHKLGITPGRGRKPDVSMYLPGTRLAAREAVSRRPPGVVVEVLSPKLRDIHRERRDKVQDYAQFGVRFYWLLDPQTRMLDILELGEDGRYTIALTAVEGLVRVPGCEGLVLDLDTLWADVDRLVDGDAPEG